MATTNNTTAEPVEIKINGKTVLSRVDYLEDTETGNRWAARALDVQFAYKFRTGTKIHVSRYIVARKDGTFAASSYGTFHNRHATLVGLWDEKNNAYKSQW